MKEKLGVDIGGVIINRAYDDTDTSFFKERYLETPAVPGAIETIRNLRDRFGEHIYLVSKAGTNTRRKSLEWLTEQQFFSATGMPVSHVHFCTERKGKTLICSQLEITHFIDDRLEVLGFLPKVPHRYLFLPREKEVRKFRHVLPHVTQVDSWTQLAELLK